MATSGQTEPLYVVMTGAAASVQFARILLFELVKGNVFGMQQPLCIHLFDKLNTDELEGVVEELHLLQDYLPLSSEVFITDDPAVAFKDVEVAFLVGGMPHVEGMDRKEFLAANVENFKAEGLALNKYAKKSVKVLVAGHQANTHVFICYKYAPSISPANFSATIHLEEKYAQSLIAKRLGIAVQQVEKVIIWGNHSSTLFPDVSNATVTVDGTVKSVNDAINDQAWITGDFISAVQKRGADARTIGMSEAIAAADTMKIWWNGTAQETLVSMAVISDGSYNIPVGVVFSFPVRCSDGQWEIIQGLCINEYTREELDKAGKKLKEEREEILAICRDSDDEAMKRFQTERMDELKERILHLESENKLLQDQLKLVQSTKDSEIAKLSEVNEIFSQALLEIARLDDSNMRSNDFVLSALQNTIAQGRELVRSLSYSKDLEELQQRDFRANKKEMESAHCSAEEEATASHRSNQFLISTPAPGQAATERDSLPFTPIIQDGSAVTGGDQSTAVTSRSSEPSEPIIQEQEMIPRPVFDKSDQSNSTE